MAGPLRQLAAAALCLLAGCGGTASPLTITRVEVVSENIDPGYWRTPPPSGQTAFFDFFLHYQGDIGFEEIALARIYPVGGSFAWDLAPNRTYLDPVARIIGGWGHWYDGYALDVLPIGDFRAEVILWGGDEAIAHALVPAPGSVTAGSNTSMFTEDLPDPPAASVPMIRRATLGPLATATASTQTLQLTFSVSDLDVANGYLRLFDAFGSSLGGFYFFRDPVSGLVDPALGGVLATDGSVNTLTVPSSRLALDGGATFGQIARYRVVLTDGAQYGLQPSGELRRSSLSISAMQAFTPQ